MYCTLRTSVVVVVFLFTAASLRAQTAVDPSGHWDGLVQVPGMDIAFQIDFAKSGTIRTAMWARRRLLASASSAGWSAVASSRSLTTRIAPWRTCARSSAWRASSRPAGEGGGTVDTGGAISVSVIFEDTGGRSVLDGVGVIADTSAAAAPEVPAAGNSLPDAVAMSGAGCAVATSAVMIEIGDESRPCGCSTHDAASTIVANTAAATSCGPTCHGLRCSPRARREALTAAMRVAISGALGSRPRISSMALFASRRLPLTIAVRAAEIGVDRQCGVYFVAGPGLVAVVQCLSRGAQVRLKSLPALPGFHVRPSCKMSSLSPGKELFLHRRDNDIIRVDHFH